jgi:hypothetical protein
VPTDSVEAILAGLRELRSEIRDIRSDYNEHARVTGERLATIEANLKSIIGNGQKGRLTLLEEAVEALNKWKWLCVGAASALSTVISFLIHSIH